MIIMNWNHTCIGHRYYNVYSYISKSNFDIQNGIFGTISSFTHEHSRPYAHGYEVDDV